MSETANMIPQNNRPFVGRSAFAHKGGIHVNAIMKVPRAYEHMDPSLVGNKRRVLVSDMSGKSNVQYKAREMVSSWDAMIKTAASSFQKSRHWRTEAINSTLPRDL